MLKEFPAPKTFLTKLLCRHTNCSSVLCCSTHLHPACSGRHMVTYFELDPWRGFTTKGWFKAIWTSANTNKLMLERDGEGRETSLMKGILSIYEYLWVSMSILSFRIIFEVHNYTIAFWYLMNCTRCNENKSHVNAKWVISYNLVPETNDTSIDPKQCK